MPVQRHSGSTAPRVFDYGDGTHAPAVQIDGVTQAFPTPLRGSVNKALLVQTATASGAGAVHLNAQGHIAQ